MKGFLKTLFSATILTAISYIAMGIILIARPEISYITLTYIAGGIIIAIGVIHVIKYIVRGISDGKLNTFLSTGLILIIVGIFMIVRAADIVVVVPIMLGLAVIIDGFIKLQRSIDLARLRFEGWVFVLILALMAIAMGVIMVVKPVDTANTLIQILGGVLVFCGVTSLAVAFFVQHKLRLLADNVVKVEEVAQRSAYVSRPVDTQGYEVPTEPAPAPVAPAAPVHQEPAPAAPVAPAPAAPAAPATEAPAAPETPAPAAETPVENPVWTPAEEARVEAAEEMAHEVAEERAHEVAQGALDAFSASDDMMNAASDGEIPFESIPLDDED